MELGLGAFLVGRTGFCIHPANQVRHIPKVGGTKDVNLAKIKKLQPTHVIVNVDENILAIAQALKACVPNVIVTHPLTPQDNIALIDQLLATFAMYSEASQAMNSPAKVLKAKINAHLEQLATTPILREQVLYLIWRQPWMTVARDTYISRMLGLIGWQTWPDAVGGEKGAARYPVLRGDEPGLKHIQRVLLSSEPYRFDASHLSEVQNWLPQAKVQLVDGEMLSWYGSRAVKGLAYLAELAGKELSPSDASSPP